MGKQVRVRKKEPVSLQARNSEPIRPQSILREIERHGERSFIPVIGPKKGKILDNVVRKVKPGTVLEVGTFIGYSAIRMARLVPKHSRIVSLEIDGNSAQIAKRNIGRAGLSDKVQVIVGDAKNIMPTLEGPFDIVFLDAEKSEYLTYLKLAEGKLHKGSVVVADNAGVFAKEMANYLGYVRNSGLYRSKYYESTLEFNDDIKDGVEVSIKI